MLQDRFMFCHFGNGICIYDTKNIVDDDYDFVAHISPDRVIEYKRALSHSDKIIIENLSQQEHYPTSTTQNENVFTCKPTINELY